MTPAVLGAREGRPATTVAGLTRALERARLVNVSLREQLHAEQREGSDLRRGRAPRGGQRPPRPAADRWDLAEQAANAIGYRAARHLRQRSSGVL
jgi:hypothetical protein